MAEVKHSSYTGRRQALFSPRSGGRSSSDSMSLRPGTSSPHRAEVLQLKTFLITIHYNAHPCEALEQSNNSGIHSRKFGGVGLALVIQP